eukprot:83075_1
MKKKAERDELERLRKLLANKDKDNDDSNKTRIQKIEPSPPNPPHPRVSIDIETLRTKDDIPSINGVKIEIYNITDIRAQLANDLATLFKGDNLDVGATFVEFPDGNSRAMVCYHHSSVRRDPVRAENNTISESRKE